MQTINISISLLGFWYIGTGQEAGAYADSLVLKDSNGLPYIPGKTIKGMFRNSFVLCLHNGLVDQDQLDYLFGIPGSSLIPSRSLTNKIDEEDELNTSGKLSFNSAELSSPEKKILIDEQLKDYLYRTVQSTAIEKEGKKAGVAKDGSLRSIEVTIPLDFMTSINIDDITYGVGEAFETQEELITKLKIAASLITEIGGKRRRGFGRCIIKVEE